MVVPAGRSRVLVASLAVAAVAIFALAAVSVPSDAYGDDGRAQCDALFSDAESDDGPSGGSSIEHAETIALFIAVAGTVLAAMALMKNRGRDRR